VALPFFLAAALTLLNRTYMDPLWHTSQGHTLVIGMLVVMALGALMLKKIVSFRG
jgi:tight adherence protein B